MSVKQILQLEQDIRSGVQTFLQAVEKPNTLLVLSHCPNPVPHFRLIADIGDLDLYAPEYFPDTHFAVAAQTLWDRHLAEYPTVSLNKGWSTKEWKFIASPPQDIQNHYDYLDTVIGVFWPLVFNKTMNEMWCGGIVSAHGDKAYGYKNEWNQHGIPFNHGVLLFLLTYESSILPYDRKSESCEWVIEHYPEYKDRILQAEQHVIDQLKHRFNTLA